MLIGNQLPDFIVATATMQRRDNMREIKTKGCYSGNCGQMTQRVFSEIGQVTARLQNMSHGMCIRI